MCVCVCVCVCVKTIKGEEEEERNRERGEREKRERGRKTGKATMQKEEKYQKSPLFYTLENKKVYGTVLLQHMRTVDPKKRICSDLKDKLTLDEIKKIRQIISQFF